ncbi:PhzF family phenazine biosynthesis protein [Nocardioides sp. ChNu-99]|uniref:PhzF family phenazine biosynthesis protein n=1 Tax=Nocardioides sp. ChNu-99 TaxID=2839897 RepID=UPI0024058AC8|nr:PhzF family phenazine biosynthesis protein [Nocardioides sp. ChNu-99]MDF9715864.1 PhzF family phenazine biosynthesis protein [Nocardioides sp. ChNu-99]
MSTHPFHQVDVFAPRPLAGNPVAVVHDAEGVPDERLAAFARWTNLSETTFLLPPTPEGAAAGADYRLRIFTPGRELPFAGHPTLGSAHAWLAAGGVPRRADVVVQECGVGLVEVRRDADGLAFAAPALLRSGPVEDDVRDRAVAALGVDPGAVLDLAWVDNGPGWLGVRLDAAATVLALRPDFAAMGDLRIGVVGAHPDGGPADVEVRAFVPSLAVPEDPVTGSLNAGLALWLTAAGVLPPSYVARQGTVLGRDGRVVVTTGDDGRVWVGGATLGLVEGVVEF